MNKNAFLILATIASLPVSALADRSRLVTDFSSEGAMTRIVPTGPTVTVKPGPEVVISPGEANFPGVNIVPPAGSPFDGSTFGYMQAEPTNTGTAPVRLTLRVDNAGDWRQNPWSSEAIGLEPGATGIVKVYFGYTVGKED